MTVDFTVPPPTLIDEGAADQQLRALLADYSARNFDTPDYQKQLHLLLADVPCTDVGNALRMATRYGRNIRYVSLWKNWYVWSGRVWKEDKTNMVLALAQEMAGYIAEEARAVQPESLTTEQEADLPDTVSAARGKSQKRAKALFKHALDSQSHRSINAALEQLKGIRGITISPDELDTADALLNTPNGTLDLYTLELRPHNRDDLITKQTGAPYDPAATCPQWEYFINKVTSGDKEVNRYLQQLTGLGLCGRRLASILAINYGSGGNGKSVYVEATKDIIGDYAMTANTELFMERPTGGPTNDIARLVGVRFLTASETRDGAPLNEALVKQLTGGDKMTARKLHQEFFEFIPRFTPMLLTNHKPVIKNTDKGIWRRLRLISWLHDFTTDPDARPFEDVMADLRQEYAGILVWAVRGFQDVITNGLIYPARVKADTEQYKRDSDLVLDFVEECIIKEADVRETKSAVYQKYAKYMKDTGHNALAENKLTVKLREMNIAEKRGAGGVRFWLGIRIKTETDIINAPDEDEDVPALEPLQEGQEGWEQI